MKEKLFCLLYLVIFCCSYSQNTPQYFSNDTYIQLITNNYYKEKNTFNILNKPSENSKLSLFLKKHISQKELKKITAYFKANPSKTTVRAKFHLKKNGAIGDIKIGLDKVNRKLSSFTTPTGGYKTERDFHFKLKKLLYTYFTEQVKLHKNMALGQHRVQIFSKKNNTAIINASNILVSDYPPLIRDCQDTTFKNYYARIHKSLTDFFKTNLNPKIVLHEKDYAELRIHFSFNINEKSKIVNPKITSFHSEEMKQEIFRILKLYENNIIGPAKRNNIPYNSSFENDISLIFKKENLKTLDKLENNSLTKYFRKKINRKYYINNYYTYGHETTVFFTFNKQGNINVWTDNLSREVFTTENKYKGKINNKIDLKNENIRKSLINLLNDKFIDSLKIDRSYDRINYLTFIRNKNGKREILCDEKFGWEKIAYYNEECVKCETYNDIITFNKSQIYQHVSLILESNKKYSNLKLNKCNNSYNCEFEVFLTFHKDSLTTHTIFTDIDMLDRKAKKYIHKKLFDYEKKNNKKDSLYIKKRISIYNKKRLELKKAMDDIIPKIPNFKKYPIDSDQQEIKTISLPLFFDY